MNKNQENQICDFNPISFCKSECTSDYLHLFLVNVATPFGKSYQLVLSDDILKCLLSSLPSDYVVTCKTIDVFYNG